MEDLSTISQPMISETDFWNYKLTSEYENLVKQSRRQADPDIVPTELQAIQTLLTELKESRIRIAVFSHNAVGKSFFLNLLLLLTAESEEECENNHREKMIKLPKEIEGDPTVKMVKDEYFEELPEVIKDFISDIEDEELEFKAFVEPLCQELHFANEEEPRRNTDLFNTLSGYFADGEQISIEPYLLPQKSIDGAFFSTTNCVLHLRYGTTFQMKVEYFDEAQLQNQLFELVLLYKESDDIESQSIYKNMKSNALESLESRLEVLTDYSQQKFRSDLELFTFPDDIKLCEEVKTFAGKTQLYIGSGIHAAEDRFALQELLNELTNEDSTKKRAAIKSIVIYLPSKLLYGGKEILELPGTDQSDPLSMSFIQDALDTVDAVVLLLESSFKNAGREVKNTLKNSGFMKNWINNPEKYKLMFLSYPEKENWCHIRKDNLEKLRRLIDKETVKRKKEMEEFGKLIHPNSLSHTMESNIFTSYALPVLYTSIHAQKGIPHQIIEENYEFLKQTGINQLISQLDKCIFQRQTIQIKEIENKMQDFQNDIYDVNSRRPSNIETASQSISFDELNFIKKNEDLFNNLKNKHKEIITVTVNGPMKHEIQSYTPIAVSKWAEMESTVTKTRIFNPQYKGKHPEFKVKMINVLFGKLIQDINPIFEELFSKLQNALTDYKTKATTMFTEELKDQGKANVLIVTGRSLEFALTWYFGRRRSGLNEDTFRKIFENHLQDSLNKHILEPVFRSGIKTTTENVNSNIENVLLELQNSFLMNVISLYDERWPDNLAKFMLRALSPVSQPGCTFCGEIKCSVCQYIHSATTFRSSSTKKTYNINHVVTCTTKSVIYLVTCKKCEVQYVGQTSNCIRRRFVDHMSTIKCKKPLSLPMHFNKADHSEQDISLLVIQKVENKERLREKEQYWIKELDTMEPKGLNRIG
ncbi:uncharacterized protein LOC128480756 [Spea bombifrons]|uniref:uncharacterized protein LOC128480756 n=1 Tax=Spea bombifrons TaxID=233779 RepID=UPI00234A176B|nr:uncharacterized protein LOC128480756 [Spea bombifrons]